MAVATIDTAQEIEQGRERLQALGAEQAGLAARAREAVERGDDRAYHKLRDREGAIPRETYALQVKLLKLELEHARERQAAVAETLPDLAATYKQAEGDSAVMIRCL